MLDQWVEKNQSQIIEAYINLRKKAGDDRPEEMMARTLAPFLEVLVEAVRQETSWLEDVRKTTETAFDLGVSKETLLTAPRFIFQAAQTVLAEQQPPEKFEWLGRLGDYTFEGNQAVTDVLTSRLRKKWQIERDQLLVEYENLYQNAQIGLVRTELDGRLLICNERLARMFGYENAEAAMAQNLNVTQHYAADEDRQRFIKELRQHGHVDNLEIPMVRTDGSPLWVSFSSRLYAEGGYLDSVLLDITERKKAEEERSHLQQQLLEAHQHTIAELSTPIIPVMDRILVMPLVGNIDSRRARDIMRTLLNGISHYRAKVVILDITGVDTVDSGVANHLDKAIQAARLKGARTIITGISDIVAETIIDLGINWSELETLSNLQTGLRLALNSLGLQLVVNDRE